jgi:hypothetical protein
MNVMLEFPGLHAHLTSMFSNYFSLWRYLQTEVTPAQSTLDWNSGVQFKTLPKKKNKEYTPGIFKDLQAAFARTIEMISHEHGGNLAHPL